MSLSTTTSSFGFLVGLISLLLLLVGGILIKRGFWPRRMGNEPYCRACGYLLIGIDSQRCPECGVFLSPLAIVHGQRRRRLGLGWTGVAVLVLLIGLLCPYLAGEFDDISWYEMKPTFWVIHDLRSSSPSDAYRAMLELKRRENGGTLSLKNEQQIIEIALAEQATTNQTQMTTELLSFLEAQCLAGHLTDSQHTRFGQQALILTLRVRPIVVLGNRVPFVISENCRVTGSPFWVRLTGEEGEAQVDSKATRGLGGGSSSAAGLGSGGSIGTSFECSTLGKHWFEQAVHVELHTGPFDGNDPRNLVFQQVCKLSGSFEIVAQPPAGDFTVIDDPKLHDLIQSKIQPQRLRLGLHNHWLQGQFNIDGPPANLAFDVIVRVGGQQIDSGIVTCYKGANAMSGIGSSLGHLNRTSQPTTIDIILRSSEKVARQTVDLHDIWKGELVYPNVPVQIDPKQ
jgi:hypothetical protein